MKKARIGWIDIAKCICIFWVILHHLESRTDSLRLIYEPFFLTGFYFCAGYVYKNRVGFLAFLYRKIRQLFIPWLIFSTFIILSRHIFSFNEQTNIWTELYDNLMQAGGGGQELWFIAALFAAFIPFYFLIRIVEHYAVRWHGHYYVALVIVAIIRLLYADLIAQIPLPWSHLWHVDVWVDIMFYMLAGYVYAHSAEAILQQSKQVRWKWALVALYAASLIPSYLGIPLADNMIWQTVVSLLGVAVVVVISKAIDHNHVMEYCGQNTLVFFALHGKVLSAMQTVIRKIIPTQYSMVLASEWKSWLLSIVLSLLILIVLIIPAYAINRWLPFLVGREGSRKS